MFETLPKAKTTKKAKRLGRGMGTGVGGHTVGRGTKGQKSRSGYSSPRRGFEGGQMPLSRRLPTLRGESKKSRGRGYNESRTMHHVLQLSEIVEKVEGDVINTVTLMEAGLVQTRSKKVTMKIVFDKAIDKKVAVEGILISASAKSAVEKAGGKVI